MTAAQGKRALVTGGHKRLGRAIALGLGAAGWDVAVHYRRDQAEAQEVVLALRALGRQSLAVQAELTDSAQVAQLVTDAAQGLGGLDLVVACAASYRPTDLRRTTAAHLDAAWAENARAPVELVLAARNLLEAGGDGRAILMGDLAGLTPYRGYLAHSMAKAALHAAVRALASELGPHLLVAGIAPGAVLKPVDEPDASWDRLQTQVPMGANALDDVALPVRAVVDAVLWLARAPRYVAGQVVAIDGGRSARW